MNKNRFGRGGVRRTAPVSRFREGQPDVVAQDREAARARPAGDGLQWKKMDLHLHTPASSDYRDPGISYLDILKKAEEKGLDMIAFADHNSIGGYAAMHREIETLTLLERLSRLTDVERSTLNEYRRLLAKIVVLPAFEFTATFGFHVLGVFPENTSVRKLEYLLLNLNVPEEKMVAGAPDAGSTSDVLTSYQAITAAGGLAIAAHANSSNGVAMQGFPFGGQTKIAYTQDPNLVALEVTDLESTGRRTTASFYNASKPEYPRRMHCIQGSDAHSLDTEQSDSFNKRLGVGARITEILVREASFAGLKEVLTGTDFTRTRPYRANWLWDLVESARIQGPNIAQSFHERAVTHTSRTRPLLHDVLAFANTSGGTVYVGANPDTKTPLHGVERPEEDMHILKEDIERMIEPALDVEFDLRLNGSRGIVVINVPKGSQPPYVFTPTGQVYVRERANTRLATRQEIIDLVLRGQGGEAVAVPTVPQRSPAAALGEPITPARPAAAAPQQQDQQSRQDQQRPWHEQRETPRVPESVERPTPAAPPQAAPVQQQAQQAPRQPLPPQVKPRPSYLASLPPEKIKGRVQPMPGSTGAPPMPASEAPAAPVPPQQEVEQAAPPVEPAAGEVGVTQPTEVAEVTPSKAKRPRARGRRGAEEARPEAVPEVILEQMGPTAEPMEATVAAEHEQREEIVAEKSEEPPKRSKRRGSRDKELQVEAPTAASAESEAGAEAILVAAEVESGPQIPANIAPAEPASKKSRSRRKSASTDGASEPAAEGRPVEAQAESAVPAEAAPTEAKPKRRSRKKSESETAVENVPESAPAQVVEPPQPPGNGVEVVSVEKRGNTDFHTMRDMRNGSMVHNVTRQSARRLWLYAILQHEHGAPAPSEVFWHPALPIGLWRRGVRAEAIRYDLVSKEPDGTLRIFYGVTADGLHGPWQELARLAEEAGYEGPKPAD